MGLKFTSKLEGDFLQIINERSAKLAAARSIAATITVPDDMVWWYYNEYGTATHSTKNPGPAYDILPHTAGALSFPGADGAQVTVSRVLHPGIKASHMVEIVREEINEFARQAVLEHLQQTNFDIDALRGFVLHDIMPRVKEIIRDSFTLQLTGTRIDGKLQGRTAAEVFEDEATIVDTST